MFEQYQVQAFFHSIASHISSFSDGYYTGLINDMHKDYEHFYEKNTFLQMEYLKQLVQQTSPIDERKLEKSQAPITLNSLSIQCTLPFDYHQLENLSPLEFLRRYTKPSVLRQQIIRKLVRKIQRDTTIDLIEGKEIVFEYFNHYQTHRTIDDLFRFLQLQSTETLQAEDLICICCYAERNFLHRLAEKEQIFFERPLQELIDFEFLKRKFAGVNFTEHFREFLQTFEAPQTNK